MRVVFFGTAGAYSAAHLDAVAESHEVVAVCCAAARGLRGAAGRLMRSTGLRADPLGAIARRHRIRRVATDRADRKLPALIASLAPDIICIAGYPWLLAEEVWRRPALGAINSHGSALPRHRGLLPLFWVYYRDDRITGATVHCVTDRADAGDILGQQTFPLTRGLPVRHLNDLHAACGSRLMVEALEALSSGRAPGIRQDEQRATAAPRVKPGTPMVDFQWDVERVWHFLAGLHPYFIEPLRDHDGRDVPYASVVGYERAQHRLRHGSVRPTALGWDLMCQGGFVRLGRRRVKPVASHA